MREVQCKVEPISKKWLNKREAMNYLGCGERLLRNLREDALIKFAIYGKNIWYNVKSIDKFLEDHQPYE